MSIVDKDLILCYYNINQIFRGYIIMKIIAHIYTDFTEKFGIPLQSGLVEGTLGRVVFEPEYRNPDALRGIEKYSHLWIIWQFSESVLDTWHATVRPPRLGGNASVGVFASRSPMRPNPIGLSSVKLVDVVKTDNEGTVLIVSGADMLDGTPIYDIKPYVSYSDCHTDAVSGFADPVKEYSLNVVFCKDLLSNIGLYLLDRDGNRHTEGCRYKLNQHRNEL